MQIQSAFLTLSLDLKPESLGSLLNALDDSLWVLESLSTVTLAESGHLMVRARFTADLWRFLEIDTDRITQAMSALLLLTASH